MKLSIIVPVYQTAQTLRRCVESILAQQFDDMELLLVDDGSTDGSGELADALAQEDARIRTFHKENGGLSSARNYGLARAKGEYIAFVDSDDALADDTLLPLMAHLATHPTIDLLEFSVTERVGCPDEHLFLTEEREFDDALDWLSEKGLTHCWAWNKIYRRTLLDGVTFPPGKHYEDVYFLADLLLKRPHIATSRQGRYLYYWNNQGIVANRNLTELLEAQLTLVRKLQIDTRERRWQRLYMDMANIQLHAYRSATSLLLSSQKVSLAMLSTRNDRIKALLINLLGLKTVCRLFKIIARK